MTGVQTCALPILKNPVGTKAVKANKKAGSVKVFSPEEIAECNAIAARIQAKA